MDFSCWCREAVDEHLTKAGGQRSREATSHPPSNLGSIPQFAGILLVAKQREVEASVCPVISTCCVLNPSATVLFIYDVKATCKCSQLVLRFEPNLLRLKKKSKISPTRAQTSVKPL